MISGVFRWLVLSGLRRLRSRSRDQLDDAASNSGAA